MSGPPHGTVTDRIGGPCVRRDAPSIWTPTTSSRYLADLHSRRGFSYGHGSVEDAFASVQLQLDSTIVTERAWCHDTLETSRS
ncbi:MAG: hypothetical protein ACRDP8_08120 [Actinopolymorphaceae bacterium]